MFYYLAVFTALGYVTGLICEHCMFHMDYCFFTLETATYLNSINMHVYVMTAIIGGLISVIDIYYSFEYQKRRPVA